MKPKIPLRIADRLKVSKPYLVRVNQGQRRLSLRKLVRLMEVAEKDGLNLSPFDFRPELRDLMPYLCKACTKK